MLAHRSDAVMYLDLISLLSTMLYWVVLYTLKMNLLSKHDFKLGIDDRLKHISTSLRSEFKSVEHFLLV